ncbi:MAG: hypothetical protein ACTSO2_13780 [Promethearchaeota archaeon]
MLILVLGHMGSGKTLLLTILGYLTNSRVISNFKLQYPNKKVENLSITQIVNEDFKDKVVILLDEAWLYLDSRRSSSSINQIFSYILFQSRKKNLNFYLTAQLGNSLDVRFRKLADFIVYCENKRFYFEYVMVNLNNNQYKTIRLPLKNAQKFFKFYNTNETIITDRSKICLLKAMSQKERKDLIDSLVQEYFNSKYKNKKITKYMVKDFLFEQNIKADRDLVDILYSRLKAIKNTK